MTMIPASLILPADQTVSDPAVSYLALSGATPAAVDPSLAKARGNVEIVVDLADAPLAVAHGEGAKKKGGKLNAAQQRQHVAGQSRQQDDLKKAIRSLGGREVGRITKALDAAIMK